jgi:hypothetical protein
MLNVILLNVLMLSVVMLYVVLNVIALNVIMLSVFMQKYRSAVTDYLRRHEIPNINLCCLSIRLT